ncbi:MAG: hypothetical protein JSS66_05470 [Armatimonadetes bacterium]|nr:hypothetical protein [Armatimonadota bacterium]
MGSGKQVGVLYVHGIGAQGENFAARDIATMKRALGADAEKCAFASYCWQTLIEPQEQAVITSSKRLAWRWLRRLFASYGGDALCYQPRHGLESFYSRVHAGLDESLKNLQQALAPDGKLVIVAHSLGTVIVNNFIWDWQHEDSVGAAAYTAETSLLTRLKVLHTQGSPLAIWALRFPDKGTPVSLSEDCVWRNVYCPSDIIGWPIKSINEAYAGMTSLTDHRIWVGGMLTRWNPMSHLRYSSSRKVNKMLANDIKAML